MSAVLCPQTARPAHWTTTKISFRLKKAFASSKAPLCLADALYLQQPQRIEALSMIMCLALMFYNLGERKLSEALSQLVKQSQTRKGDQPNNPRSDGYFNSSKESRYSQ